ncbi:hypothetical protein EM868_09140 [Cupriavidus gilardii]|uniref:hypothetical protein n=1 Tax=Cupriavidus gilardii TaxID=82541 RepID=UPI001EE628C4|nr:hypothetical protein [Cupriavidus gilardii]MCG5259781.1 hypothetical protein [Cupriavidus gilardii]MDF9429961.1 hypothetical protein [Cupriavidus gilardii]
MIDDTTTDYRVHRSLRDACGPKAQLQVEPEYDLTDWLLVAVYGIGIGALWYLAVALRAGA